MPMTSVRDRSLYAARQESFNTILVHNIFLYSCSLKIYVEIIIIISIDANCRSKNYWYKSYGFVIWYFQCICIFNQPALFLAKLKTCEYLTIQHIATKQELNSICISGKISSLFYVHSLSLLFYVKIVFWIIEKW